MRKKGISANVYLGLLVCIIAIVAIVAALISGNSVKTLEKGSPQRVVQSYLQAISDGRNDLAAKYFSKESKCTVEDIDRAYMNRNIQVSLLKTEIDNKNAVIHVSIQQNSTLLADDMGNDSQSFRLILEKTGWKLTGIPWPLYDCGVIRK